MGTISNFYVCLKENLKVCLICVVLTTIIWLAGYLEISFAWIIVAIAIYAMWDFKESTRKNRRTHLQKAAQVSYISKIEKLPSWVYFSEYETAIWLNDVISHMWPFIESIIQKILKESVEPEMQKNLPKTLQTINFEKIILGRKAPMITNLKTYRTEPAKKRNEFIMDANITYNGDSKLKLALKNVKLGISDIQLNGTLRIIFKPLLSSYNPIGGITVFFLNRPEISFNLTNLLNILDFPGLKQTLRNIIDDVVASFVVLPNRIAVPLVKGVDSSDLQYPIPEGVLRLEILEARELIATDFMLIPKSGKAADPYAIVGVGAQKFRTKVKKGDQNPVWNERFDAFVDNAEGQQFEIHIFDQDISKDTHMGHLATKIASCIQQGSRDVWLPLEGVRQGKLHLKIHWLLLSNSIHDLSPPSNGKKVAALIVKIIRVCNLPAESLKAKETRSMFCKLSVDGDSVETFQTVGRTDVEWKQALRILLAVPKLQSVKIDVIESKSRKSLGFMKFPICCLLDEPNMSLEKEFKLKDSGTNSTVLCRLTLRALRDINVDKPDEREQKNPNHTNKLQNKIFMTDGRLSRNTKRPKIVLTDVDSKSDILWFSSSSTIGSSESSSKNIAIRGEVQVTLKYNHVNNRLLVNVERAYGLVSRDVPSKTNSYVRLYLLPDRSKSTRRQTAVISGTLNPHFNAKFEYYVGLDQLKIRQLEVTVKYNRIGLATLRRKSIGYSVISLDDVNLNDGETLNCDLMKITRKTLLQRQSSFR